MSIALFSEASLLPREKPFRSHHTCCARERLVFRNHLCVTMIVAHVQPSQSLRKLDEAAEGGPGALTKNGRHEMLQTL